MPSSAFEMAYLSTATYNKDLASSYESSKNMSVKHGTTRAKYSLPKPVGNESQCLRFKRFFEMPADLRAPSWKATALSEPPRILTLTTRRNSRSTSTLSSSYSHLALVSTESSEPRHKILGNCTTGILAASTELDTVHFGPSYRLPQLKALQKTIGISQAGNVRQLILEVEVTKTHVPNFLEICRLFPRLESIAFLLQEPGHGSENLKGNVVFAEACFCPLCSPVEETVSEGPKIAACREVQAIRQMARSLYPFSLEWQLSRANEIKTRPKILFWRRKQVGLREGKAVAERRRLGGQGNMDVLPAAMDTRKIELVEG